MVGSEATQIYKNFSIPVADTKKFEYFGQNLKTKALSLLFYRR